MNSCLPQKRCVAKKSKFKTEENFNNAQNLFLSVKSYLIGYYTCVKACIRKIRPFYLKPI